MIIEKLKTKFDERDGSLYGEKNIKESLAMLYHENSKFTEYTLREQSEKIGAFSNSFIVERSSQPFKCYPNQQTLTLNRYCESEKQTQSNGYSYFLRNRKSIRIFDRKYKISLYELSVLMFESYGVTRKEKINDVSVEGHLGLRNVSSAGGLYPLEIYLVVLNGDIEQGLYHYRPDLNCLELLKRGDDREVLNKIIQAEPFIDLKSASCILLTTGFIERSIIKYGDRGYRFLMMEVGMVSQNISLLATSLGLGSCMIGGYNDDLVNQYLGIDGVFETVNNVIVVGKNQSG